MANQSYRQIASLHIGDRVASRNELTGRYGSNLITALPGRFHDDKVTMQLEGADGRLETIVTTLEHPFYIAGRGFVEAGDMKAGMKVSRWQARAPPVASAVNSLSGFQSSAPLVQTVGYRKADTTGSLLSRWLSQASEWLGIGATPAQAAPRSVLATKSQSLLVKSISITRTGLKSWRAYNLTVANDHTYFVGNSGAWVHNAGCFDTIKDLSKDINNFKTDAVKGGVFKNAEAETLYQSYRARKIREGVPANQIRARNDWASQVRAFALGPVGRGIEFNALAKRKEWYKFNEVAVRDQTGKSGNGLWRLDSYQPDKFIVSRKAVDLSTINPSVFKAYLKEFKSKYPIGAEIRARGIAGTKLSGQYVLEIPRQTNPSHFRRYKSIAHNMGVLVRQRNF